MNFAAVKKPMRRRAVRTLFCERGDTGSTKKTRILLSVICKLLMLDRICCAETPKKCAETAFYGAFQFLHIIELIYLSIFIFIYKRERYKRNTINKLTVFNAQKTAGSARILRIKKAYGAWFNVVRGFSAQIARTNLYIKNKRISMKLDEMRGCAGCAAPGGFFHG